MNIVNYMEYQSQLMDTGEESSTQQRKLKDIIHIISALASITVNIVIINILQFSSININIYIT